MQALQGPEKLELNQASVARGRILRHQYDTDMRVDARVGSSQCPQELPDDHAFPHPQPRGFFVGLIPIDLSIPIDQKSEFVPTMSTTRKVIGRRSKKQQCDHSSSTFIMCHAIATFEPTVLLTLPTARSLTQSAGTQF